MPILDVPYFSQRDNANHPGGTCNVTSIAMIMAAYGIVGDGSGKQLEDQLYEYAQSKRLVIGSPYDMKKIYEWKPGFKDDFTLDNSMWIQKVKENILAGIPMTIHAQFTPAGHVIDVVGFENNNLVCHDPNGKFSGTYGVWAELGGASGKFVRYSYEMMDKFCNIAGTVWRHNVTRRGHTIKRLS